MQKIILASGSPRRKEMMELLGLEFEVVNSDYDENLVTTDDPRELVEELALEKTLAVAKRYPDAIIVGGDTVVVLNGEIIGKSETKREAKQIFGKLLGKTHEVMTGVAVINSLTGERYVGSEMGKVTFREGTEEELERYAGKETNWRGFAGAYALQGGAAAFVNEQTGKLSAVIGMPVELTVSLFEKAGVVVERDAQEVEMSLKGMKIGIKEG